MTIFTKPLITLAAAVLSATFAPTAHADLVFRFHNLSQVEAKGIMQNVGIVWLRRGQVETVNARGDWSSGCSGSMCGAILKDTYVANFQHLADGNMHQYCVWRIKRSINHAPKGQVDGSVTLTIELEHQDPAYVCNHSGQTSASYSTGLFNQGNGMTHDFSMTSK